MSRGVNCGAMWSTNAPELLRHDPPSRLDGIDRTGFRPVFKEHGPEPARVDDDGGHRCRDPVDGAGSNSYTRAMPCRAASPR
jgi:hypothetical protein